MLQGEKTLSNIINGLKSSASSLKEPYERMRRTQYKKELADYLWGNPNLDEKQKQKIYNNTLNQINSLIPKPKPKLMQTNNPKFGPAQTPTSRPKIQQKKPSLIDKLSNKFDKILPKSKTELYKTISDIAKKNTDSKGNFNQNAFYLELSKDKAAKKIFDDLRKQNLEKARVNNKKTLWGENDINKYTTPELEKLYNIKKREEWDKDKKTPHNTQRYIRTTKYNYDLKGAIDSWNKAIDEAKSKLKRKDPMLPYTPLKKTDITALALEPLISTFTNVPEKFDLHNNQELYQQIQTLRKKMNQIQNAKGYVESLVPDISKEELDPIKTIVPSKFLSQHSLRSVYNKYNKKNIMSNNMLKKSGHNLMQVLTSNIRDYQNNVYSKDDKKAVKDDLRNFGVFDNNGNFRVTNNFVKKYMLLQDMARKTPKTPSEAFYKSLAGKILPILDNQILKPY